MFSLFSLRGCSRQTFLEEARGPGRRCGQHQVHGDYAQSFPKHACCVRVRSVCRTVSLKLLNGISADILEAVGPGGYKFRAFGYEVRVSQDKNGNWSGFYREGGTGEFTFVTSRADVNETKIAICRYVQTLAGRVNESGLDPCAKAVDDWKAI